MTKKLLFVFVILICGLFLNFQNVSSANVDLVTYVYEDETIFNYIFSFGDDENYDKFSIEKPKDARLDYVVDETGPIEYELAGDYFIFRPEKTRGQTILLKFRSRIISTEVYTTQAFKTYVNFDFPVSSLEFKSDFKDNFGEIISIFPENYVLLPNNKIYWESYNLSGDTLYVVNFKDNLDVSNEPSNFYGEIPLYYYLIIFLLILIVIIGFFLLYQQFFSKKNDSSEIVLKKSFSNRLRKRKDLNSKKKVVIENLDAEYSEMSDDEIVDDSDDVGGFSQVRTETIQKKKEITLEEKKEKIYKEIMEKHLTENEQDVVRVVKENEGIAQNDILNHLPKITKSNLSKIISKLNSRKILKRIKVGNVNNIYLGEKLEGKDLVETENVSSE